MTKINKLAKADASRWARAEMFFGEGAGTRRKLLSAEIATKVERISGYHEAFEKALKNEDMGEHAMKAMKERRRIDGGKFLARNARGLVTGNKQSLSTGIAVTVALVAMAHQTGLDEPIKREAKKQYQKGKAYVDKKQAIRKGKRSWAEATKNVTFADSKIR